MYQFIISCIDLGAIYFTRADGISNLTWWISIIVLNSLFLFLIVEILYRFVDFEMDFIIVTQDEIESFDQV